MLAHILLGLFSTILFVNSSGAAVRSERLSDRLTSSDRVDEALEVCEHLLGERLRANEIPMSVFETCLMTYIKKLALEIDGVDIIFPKTFT